MEKTKMFWETNLEEELQSIMMTIPISKPLGLSACIFLNKFLVIGSLENFGYITLPDFLNDSKTFELIHSQNSNVIISDKQFYQREIPPVKYIHIVLRIIFQL